MLPATTRRIALRVRLVLAIAIGILAGLLLPLVRHPEADAAVWAITGPTNTLAKVGAPITLDSFVVTSGTPASVSISISPSTAGTLTLVCGSSCAGITYDRGDGIADTRMRITGTRAAVNAALTSMRFDPTTLGTASITANVVDGNLAWDPLNEHLYAFVPGTVDWATALTGATGSNLYGWQGYLTTITSSAEDVRVSRLANGGAVFLGGTDEVSEGVWKWKGGPQDGLVFWTPTCGVGLSGLCLDTGAVSNWKTGEPSAATTNEDYVVKGSSGQWLDTVDTSTCCGYVIEYGGIGTFAPPTATAAITVVNFDPVVNQIQVAPATTTSTTEPATTSTESPTTTRAVTSGTGATTTKVAPTTTRTDPTTSRSSTTRLTTTTRTPPTTASITTSPPPTTGSTSAGGTGGGSGASAVDGSGDGAVGDGTDAAAVGSTGGLEGTVAAPTTAPSLEDASQVESTRTTPAPGDALAADADVFLRLRAAIGDHAAGQRVDFDGHGLPPGAALQGIVRSDPTVIADGTVDREGTFHAEGVLPEGLAPGTHHLELATIDGTVLARAALRIRADGTIGDADASLDVVGGPYDPFQHVPDALGALVAATVALAAVSGGRSSEAATSGTDSGTDDDAPGGGSVAGLDLAVEATLATGHGWGDRHRTWNAPGTATIDRWASTMPSRVQRHSAHLARAIAEGAYLRAMIGSLWALLPIAGIVCGAMAWSHGNRGLLSPDWRWTAAVLAISTLDGLAGLGAAAIIVVGAIAAGHVTDVPSGLTVAGLIVLLAGPPAVASAARPIGRLRGRSLGDRWDRAADVLLAAALTALAVRAMAGALSGLRGRVLPIADRADGLAITVLVAVTVRVILESLANNHWPDRRRRCEPPEPPAQSDLQRSVIPLARGVLFLLASHRFIGINWALLIGALLTVGPMVLGLDPKRLGHHPWTHRLVLRRLTKWFVLLVIGTYVSVELAEHVTDPHRLLLIGFVVLLIPGALADVIGALGHDADDTEITWWHRAAGLVAFVIGALFALGHLP